MAIYYLDADDEITSAAARIRDSSDNRIALVLSNGSRVATSRINFRLLAREARKRNKRIAIVAADPSVQSVARTAELAVYSTVGEYERAEAARTAAGHDPNSADLTDALDELALTVAPGSRPGAPIGRAARPPIGAPSVTSGAGGGGRRISRPAVAGLLALLALVLAGGMFFFLPGATVALTLREDSLGPVTFSVKVDPAVTAANDQTATVPGTRKSFPVSASATFEATGQKIDETAATGTVTFTSTNTLFAVPVLAGTQVTAAGGVAFVTTQTVSVPVATVSADFRLTPGRADAPVAAVNKGLSGNVAANKIVKLPADLVSAKVTVTNVAPTTGGTHTVTQQIQQSDIDKAQGSLGAELVSRLRATLDEPAAEPSGLTLFAESALIGTASCSPEAGTLVGQAQPTFDMECSATGTAEMADAASIRTLAERRIKSLVKSGYKLVANSIKTEFGKPVSDGATVTVPVVASGRQVPAIDENQVRAVVKGKSLDQARTALATYGTVDISVSPSWASTLPNFDFRIDVQLVVPASTPAASGSAAPTRTVAPPVRTATPAPSTVSPPASGSVPPASATPTDSPTPPPPTTAPTPAPSDSGGSAASPSPA